MVIDEQTMLEPGRILYLKGQDQKLIFKIVYTNGFNIQEYKDP